MPIPNRSREEIAIGSSEQRSQNPAHTVGTVGPDPSSTVPLMQILIGPAHADTNPASDRQASQHSQSAQDKLRFLRREEWDEGMAYSEMPASSIRYTVEWKVTTSERSKSNKKILARNTEQNVVMLPGRPPPLWGALVVWKCRKLERIRRTQRSLHPTISAISRSFSARLLTMPSSSACWETLRFGAILAVSLAYAYAVFRRRV